MSRECSFNEMCRDHDLQYHYRCNECGREQTQSAYYDGSGPCSCGGTFEKTGESYDA